MTLSSASRMCAETKLAPIPLQQQPPLATPFPVQDEPPACRTRCAQLCQAFGRASLVAGAGGLTGGALGLGLNLLGAATAPFIGLTVGAGVALSLGMHALKEYAKSTLDGSSPPVPTGTGVLAESQTRKLQATFGGVLYILQGAMNSVPFGARAFAIRAGYDYIEKMMEASESGDLNSAIHFACAAIFLMAGNQISASAAGLFGAGSELSKRAIASLADAGGTPFLQPPKPPPPLLVVGAFAMPSTFTLMGELTAFATSPDAPVPGSLAPESLLAGMGFTDYMPTKASLAQGSALTGAGIAMANCLYQRDDEWAEMVNLSAKETSPPGNLKAVLLSQFVGRTTAATRMADNQIPGKAYGPVPLHPALLEAVRVLILEMARPHPEHRAHKAVITMTLGCYMGSWVQQLNHWMQMNTPDVMKAIDTDKPGLPMKVLEALRDSIGTTVAFMAASGSFDDSFSHEQAFASWSPSGINLPVLVAVGATGTVGMIFLCCKGSLSKHLPQRESTVDALRRTGAIGFGLVAGIGMGGHPSMPMELSAGLTTLMLSLTSRVSRRPEAGPQVPPIETKGVPQREETTIELVVEHEKHGTEPRIKPTATPLPTLLAEEPDSIPEPLPRSYQELFLSQHEASTLESPTSERPAQSWTTVHTATPVRTQTTTVSTRERKDTVDIPAEIPRKESMDSSSLRQRASNPIEKTVRFETPPSSTGTGEGTPLVPKTSRKPVQ